MNDCNLPRPVPPCSGPCIRALAAAKLNLFLELLARRSDGYHELSTLLVPVSLYDDVEVALDSSPAITVRCRWAAGMTAANPRVYADADLPQDEQNLAHRAVKLLRQAIGETRGLRIQILKRIPAAAGLGGASSDAAAALLAAARLWGAVDLELLRAVASQVGSDVPFFLPAAGGRLTAAWCTGRGEQVAPAPSSPRFHLVIVKPPSGLATADVYRACRVPESPESSLRCQRAFERGCWRELGAAMRNRLQEPARRLSPCVARLEAEFAAARVVAHQLSGSGTSYFGLCRNRRHAWRVGRHLRARNLGSVFCVATLSPRAVARVPNRLAKQDEGALDGDHRG